MKEADLTGVIGDAVREGGIQTRTKDTKLLKDDSKSHRQRREDEHHFENKSLMISVPHRDSTLALISQPRKQSI